MNHPVQIRIEAATPHDVACVIRDIRPEDANEIEMGGICDVEKAVSYSAASSISTFAAWAGNDLLCVFGAVRTSDSSALIWEIGTNHVRRHAKAFVRATPVMLAACMESAPEISRFVNCLPEHYSTYRKWLERHAGAKFDAFVSRSRTGFLFRTFEITRKGA